MILDNDGEMVFTAVDAYQRRSYDATVKTDVKPKAVDRNEQHRDDASSTSA